MRRAGLGEGASAGSYGYTNSGYSVYEEENERLTESLRTKVSAIKSLSIEIGTEVKNQNKMLSEMDNDFDSAGGLLGATMGRLRTLSRGSQTKLLCYMMLFALFVFFVIYWIIKLRVPVYLFGNSAAFKGLYLCGEHHENKKWRSHHFGLACKASQALPGVFCWTTCSDYLHLTY